MKGREEGERTLIILRLGGEGWAWLGILGGFMSYRLVLLTSGCYMEYQAVDDD